MKLSKAKIKLVEDIKTILNLNPISNPATQTTLEELVTIVTLLADDELLSFKQFARDNRKFDNGESGYDRLLTVSEKYQAQKNQKQKQILVEQAKSKMDFLIMSIGAVSPKMKEMIELTDSRIYSSKIINSRSPIFDEEYKYEYLVGVIKNYCSKVNKAYTSDIEKQILVEMFDKNILADEIYEFVNIHSNSIMAKVETLNAKVKKLEDSDFPDPVEAYNNQIKKLLNQQSTYAWFRNSIIDSLLPMMPQIKDLLQYDHESELNFKKFEKVSIDGKTPFNQKAIKTLNKIGFREVYKMSEDDLREALRKEVLGIKTSNNQLSGSDRVMALIGKVVA